MLRITCGYAHQVHFTPVFTGVFYCRYQKSSSEHLNQIGLAPDCRAKLQKIYDIMAT